MTFSVVGKRVAKKDALAKAIGETRYIQDIKLPHMLHGKILRSPHAHARIVRIDTSRAKRLAGVKAVITAGDTPRIKFGFGKDHLPLKEGKVRCLRDEVAAVAAVDEETAAYALSLIRVEYEELPAIFDAEEALRPQAPLIHEHLPNNLVPIPYAFSNGDVEEALARSTHVVEGRFRLPFVHHACMGTLACIARFEGDGRLTVWSTTQVPFLYQRELAEAIGLHGDRVRVIQPPLGGGFGRGLDLYPIDLICIFLAKAAGRPVKIAYRREEEFFAAPGRQPCLIDLKTAADRDGRLTARKAEVLLDNGAYVSWGATIPLVMMATVTGLYRVPVVSFNARIVYTNNPFSGAMRGYGNLQSTFAVESQMDALAAQVGLDPLAFRRLNANAPGEVTPQKMRITTCGFDECLEKAGGGLWNGKDGGGTAASQDGGRRGRGLASLFHVAGGARVYKSDGCGAMVKVDDFGQVVLITGASEIGQGADTVLCQIVAEELGVPLERVEFMNADTSLTPWDVGVHASRTTFIAGNAARLAARQAKEQILQHAARMLEASVEDLELQEGQVLVKGSPGRALAYDKVIRAMHFKEQSAIIMGQAFYDPPTERQGGDFEGNISASYTFGTQAVQVEVDEETGQVKILKVTSAHDVGRALNPVGLEGQIEGGAAMGLGYALTEQLIVQQGRILNPGFKDYKLLTALDMPPLEAVLVETDDPAGPFGAKGIGETGAIAPAPAVANAIYDAVGVRITDLPLTPERLLRAMKGWRS